MSIKEKIANAKLTTWPADGIPKWKVTLVIKIARLKERMRKGR